jgi:hypothetical protein
MNQLLTHSETTHILEQNLSKRLIKEFPEVSLEAVHYSMKAYLPECIEKVLVERKDWTPTKQNYSETCIDIVKMAFKLCTNNLQTMNTEQQFMDRQYIYDKQ